jgi:alanyl-tRNA synthetase
VQGNVEAARRRVHMALHTGQHILSRAFVEIARADTISSRLGETECTIDVTVAELSEPHLAKVEDLVNEIVDADLSIQAFFPDPERLASLALRRAPKVRENVRIVSIGDFDSTPCGGTHCHRSAQVGLLKVSGIERYKGGTRVRFSAGQRARLELGGQANLLQVLARDFSCNSHELPAAVGKLRRELGDARAELAALRLEHAERLAERALAEAEESGRERIVLVLPNAKVELLRAIGSRVTAVPGKVALLAAPSAEGCSVLVARGESSAFDCGAFLKRAAQQTGGRGGGRAERAEGRLPAETAWPELVAALLND